MTTEGVWPDYPVLTCTKCHAEQPDLDGFGFMYCPECKLCTHSSRTDGKCDFCGHEAENFNCACGSTTRRHSCAIFPPFPSWGHRP